mmetsp:Transcript_30202/g.61531  ORF Transcript_30202/g.61531 Transcript_30202/m.61531 type:complete len:157 (-) Transcript_30202:8-478(-)
MASAVFHGSCSSGGAGALSVFTAQKRQPRVHVSPRTMMVPVPPFQHSPIFGHWASSHTVASPSSLTEALSSSKRESLPPGAGTWNQSGLRPGGISPPTFGMTPDEGVVDSCVTSSDLLTTSAGDRVEPNQDTPRSTQPKRQPNQRKVAERHGIFGF